MLAPKAHTQATVGMHLPHYPQNTHLPSHLTSLFYTQLPTSPFSPHLPLLYPLPCSNTSPHLPLLYPPPAQTPHLTYPWQSWDGRSYCGVWPQRPLRGSPGMVGVTLVCGLRDPCAAVLGWWELLLCVSPGMVGVTVVCGLRDPCAAVCGVCRLPTAISSHFVWHGMKRDVCKWCRECHPCQASKIHRHIQAPLTERPPPDRRFGSLHVDLVGPLDESEGMKYLFMVIDRFTRWPEAIPLPDSTTETCSRALIRHWVPRFGVADDITSDRGPQFTISSSNTTAYRPQANGLVERFLISLI